MAKFIRILCATFLCVLLISADANSSQAEAPSSNAQAGEGSPAADQSGGDQGQEQPKLNPDLPPEMQCMAARGKIVFAMINRDLPPFSMMNSKGELVGIDVDLAKAIGKELGLKVEFIRTASTFEEVVDQVVERKADMAISKLSLTLSRAKKIRYTDPYVLLRKALFLNRLLLEKLKQSDDESLKSLFGRTTRKIGVIANSSYVDFAKRIFPKAEIVEFDTWDKSIQATLKGEVLASFRDEWEVRKVMDSVSDASISGLAVMIIEELDPIMVVVPWNHTHLLSWLNSYLELLKIQLNVEDVFSVYKKFKSEKMSQEQE